MRSCRRNVRNSKERSILFFSHYPRAMYLLRLACTLILTVQRLKTVGVSVRKATRILFRTRKGVAAHDRAVAWCSLRYQKTSFLSISATDKITRHDRYYIYETFRVGTVLTINGSIAVSNYATSMWSTVVGDQCDYDHD